MPRLTNSVPKYRKHRASGQAIVTIAGRDHYLGLWRSKASKAEYERLVGEWLTAGRPTHASRSANDVTVSELIAKFWTFAKGFYMKNGKPTGTAANFRPVLSLMRESYGHTAAAEFGPLALKAVRARMIELGNSRRYVNDNVDRIRQMFKWGASEELIPPNVFQALTTVSGLRKGRTEAREPEPITPVEDGVVEATLDQLPTLLADMIRFQRLTGCRPGEACKIRPCDLDTSGEVWAYTPESHKTEHHGRQRVIYIGPKAQDVLRPYLLRDKTAYCFSPKDSERKRRAVQHDQRKTPLSCGNRPGSNKRRKPNRTAGDRYNKDSYCRAIHRACDRAFPPPKELEGDELKAWRNSQRWNPNQLRHAAATEIRKRFGLEAAQVTLGHANADVTQVYAERDMTLAAKIMKDVG